MNCGIRHTLDIEDQIKRTEIIKPGMSGYGSNRINSRARIFSTSQAPVRGRPGPVVKSLGKY